MLNKQAAVELIKLRLSDNRFRHSLQVAVMAGELAEHYGLNAEKAYYTGLLHDYAKGMSGQELLQIARQNNLLENEADREVPDLLHAPVGAFLLNKDLGIEDEEILVAVSSHTLGSLNMSEFDKVIFLADMIEPGRDYPSLERLKCLAFRNLDEGMLFGLESTIKYCLDCGRILHPRTVMVRNQYLHRVKSKG